MNQPKEGFPAPDTAGAALVARASVPVSVPHPLRRLEEALGPGPFAVVILFVSPDADLDALALRLPGRFGGAVIIGCSTAGEISDHGYAEGEIVAVGLPVAHFAADVLLIPDLSVLEREALIGRLIRSRQAPRGQHIHKARRSVQGRGPKPRSAHETLHRSLSSLLALPKCGKITRFRASADQNSPLAQSAPPASGFAHPTFA